MQKAPVLKASGLKPLDDGDNNKEESPKHVFGKNLEDRVIAPLDEESEEARSSGPSTKNEEEEEINSIRKRKFDTITGEEDEETVFQGDFSLFVWNPELSYWVETGRGQLRLNDQVENKEENFSRIIMRIGGTLRIVLNVALNPHYFKVISATKQNIRFTDSQTVWAARGNNANELNDLIVERLKISKKAKR